jgi:SAM-dependent methyltransferase
LNPTVPNDIPFYRSKIPSPSARILELGCGTGRVLLPLANSCGYIHGIEKSAAMLSICQEKLQKAGIPPRRAFVEVGDITGFDLGQRFDLIIAPFRVLQNLETDEAVRGLFQGISRHLSPQGTCILNVFRPYKDAEGLRREWCSDQENFGWEMPFDGGTLTCHDRRPRLDPDKLVLYPELIYRHYRGERLVDEAVLKIAMRCYYPGEFAQLIIDHGFRIIERCGGYSGESYGEGPELVVQFATTNLTD